MSPNMLAGKQGDCVQKGYQAVKSELVCLTEQRNQVGQKPDGSDAVMLKAFVNPRGKSGATVVWRPFHLNPKGLDLDCSV